jgi:YggT family protein
MLIGTLALVLQSVAGFFTALLLIRTVMRFLRISFVSQLGQFVLATTNWAVVPLQRFVPSIGRLELSALLPAWVIQALLALLLTLLTHAFAPSPQQLVLVALISGTLGLLKVAILMLSWVVILTAILSFVNPYSPFCGPLNVFTRPFLRPFQRILPPIGGIDLSPLLLLLVLQIILYWLP